MGLQNFSALTIFLSAILFFSCGRERDYDSAVLRVNVIEQCNPHLFKNTMMSFRQGRPIIAKCLTNRKRYEFRLLNLHNSGYSDSEIMLRYQNSDLVYAKLLKISEDSLRLYTLNLTRELNHSFLCSKSYKVHGNDFRVIFYFKDGYEIIYVYDLIKAAADVRFQEYLATELKEVKSNWYYRKRND